MAARYVLPAATELKPLTQGTLSRLCGLYSILNGVRLALYPQRLGASEVQSLYLEGVGHLSRRRQLKLVLGVGMQEDVWLSLAAHLLEHANRTHNAALRLVPTFPHKAKRRGAIGAMQKVICGGSPVLVSFGGALDHFTVVVGHTERRLILFDSSGLRWVETAHVGVGENSRRRHWINHAGTAAIFDDW